MNLHYCRHPNLLAACLLVVCCVSVAEEIPVRHVEGVTFGFLVLRNLEGRPIAYGNLKQVATPNDGVVTDDLQFHFKDGSLYHEITKFTQRGTFRLVSDQIVQNGPSFKKSFESWLDMASGKITVRSLDNGKDKQTVKHLDLPSDVYNGLLFILVKNIDPSAAETDVSMVTSSTTPRIVKLRFVPGEEKTVKLGQLRFKAQHYIMKVKIEGAAGAVAPLVGKQPSDFHFWTVKSESPTFVEFQGSLSDNGPVWRIELAAPEKDEAR